MPRKRDDFLEAYLEYTKNTESPISYHIWAGLSVIASALERKVYMPWGHTEVFPNQYIVLIGPSGVRKGEPLTIARSFLSAIGTNLVSEAITKEAFIRRMKNAMTNFMSGTQFQCAITCVAEELSVFIGNNDVGFLQDLTNWYDSRDKWTYETKGSGIDEVMGVCVNLLASMAPDWIPMTFPMGAIGGGFTSRILFIVEHRKGRNISNPNAIVVDEKLRSDLEADLEMIRQMVGTMRFDSLALASYERWYIQEEQRTASGNPAVKDSRFSGYVARRATHVKKVAMACSAARSNSMTISEVDFSRALQLLVQAERNMSDVFGKVGRAANAEMTQEVLNFIQQRGRATRAEVMQAFYRDIDAGTLEVIESTLKAAQFIKVAGMDAASGNITYKFIG